MNYHQDQEKKVKVEKSTKKIVDSQTSSKKVLFKKNSLESLVDGIL